MLDCGGMLDCGECDSSGGGTCTPLVCELNACGIQGDGCDGEMDCGACPSGTCMGGVCVCTNDELGNASQSGAEDFGLHGQEGFEGGVTDLVIAGGEEDWFLLGVADTYHLGNPTFGFAVRAPGSNRALEMAVVLECHNGAPASVECAGGSYDEGTGACLLSVPAGAPERAVDVSYNCSGPNEDATAYAVVMASDCAGADCPPACEPYHLEVWVE